MHVEAGYLHIPSSMLLSFGLLLCRMTGLLVFLPIPGLRQGVETNRLALGVLFAFLLVPWAGNPGLQGYSLAGVLRILSAEVALGLGLGLCVGLIQEGIQLGTHMIGLQAGFSYASTIDPTSNADSAILQVLMSLGSSLLFLSCGFDTILLRFLLSGVQSVPPGQWELTPQHVGAVMALFPQVFVDAIRYALPVVAVLLLIDMALALLSRIQPQLQLLSLSFPLKMLASMVVIAYGAPMLPGAVERTSVRSLEVIRLLLAEPK